MTKPLSETIASLLLLLDGKGEGTPKNIDQRLADSKATLVDIQTQVDALTREHATAKAELQTAKDEVTRLTEQFNTATTEATTAKADVTRLNGELSSEKTAHAATKTTLTTANDNVGRLEKLLSLKGIDPKQTVPPDNSGGENKPTLDELNAEMVAAKGDPKKVAAVVARVTKFYGEETK